jgi:hypothetical protein
MNESIIKLTISKIKFKYSKYWEFLYDKNKSKNNN